MDSMKNIFLSLVVPPMENTQKRMDGKLISVMLVASVVPFLLVVVAVVTIRSIIEHNYQNTYSAESLIDAFFGFSTLFMIVLMFLPSHCISRMTKPKEKLSFSHKPKLVFLWLFGIGIIAYYALKLADYIDSQMKNRSTFFTYEAATFVTLTLVEMIAISTQLIFLTKFSNYTFRSTVLINFGMSIIVTGHISEWFYTILMSCHRHRVLSNQLKSENISHSGLETLVKNVDCLIPVQTEYNLLALGFVFGIWNRNQSSEILSSSQNNLDPRRHKSVRHTETQTSVSRSTLSGNCKSLEPQRIPHERTRLLCKSYPGRDHQYSSSDVVINEIAFDEPGDELRSVTNNERHATSTEAQEEQRSGSLYITAIIGMIMFAAYIVASVFTTFVYKDSDFMRFLFEVIQCIYTTVCLFLVCTALVLANVCSERHYRRTIYREKQYILTICTSGAIAFGTLCFLAGALYKSEEYYESMTTTAVKYGQILRIFVIILQTIFIIHSENLGFTRLSKTLQNSIVLLGILNFTFWIADSFIISSYDDDMKDSWIETQFYSPRVWATIRETIFPFTIFYRFHSSMDMYERYKQMRQITSS